MGRSYLDRRGDSRSRRFTYSYVLIASSLLVADAGWVMHLDARSEGQKVEVRRSWSHGRRQYVDAGTWAAKEKKKKKEAKCRIYVFMCSNGL